VKDKTAARGELWRIWDHEGAKSVSGKIILPLTIKSRNAKRSVRVVLELESYDIPHLIRRLKFAAKERAEALESHAKWLVDTND
jgi:hypothetical protein